MASRMIERFEENVLMSLLVGITLLVFVEVILRFVFNTGVLWIQEVTLHASAWFVLFGASYGVKVGAHIGVDAFVKLLPDEMRRVISIFALALCLVYCALFLYGSWVYLAKMYSLGISLEDARIPAFLAHALGDAGWEIFRIDEEDPLVPLWIAHSPLVIGFALLAFRLGDLGWRVVTGTATGFNLADEVREVMEQAKSSDEGGATPGENGQ